MARSFVRANSEYLTVAAAPVGAPPLTLACWFCPLSTLVDYDLLSLESGANYFTLRATGMLANDPLRAVARFTGTGTASTTSGFKANTWQHGCAVFAGSSDRRVYLDGAGKGTNATAVTGTSANRTSVGARYGTGVITNPLGGAIAFPAIWAAALTDDEVALLARGVRPDKIRPAALVAYWRFTARPSCGLERDERGPYHLSPIGTSWAPDPPLNRPAVRARQVKRVPPAVVHRRLVTRSAHDLHERVWPWLP